MYEKVCNAAETLMKVELETEVSLCRFLLQRTSSANTEYWNTLSDAIFDVSLLMCFLLLHLHHFETYQHHVGAPECVCVSLCV